MTTPTELANMALAHLGQARISDFSERSPAAEHCRRAFDHVRRLCLRDYDWNFAVRRATLTAAEAPPEFDWGYEYPLPSDCLRVISVNQRPGGTRLTDYAVEGRAILSNSADCRVRYIRDVTDPTLWDSMFSSYFCYRLAAAIAPSLRLDPAAGQQMEQMAAAIRDQAREADAVESEPRVTRLDQSEMIEDREGRWGPGTASGGGSTPEATVINLTGAGTATTYTITPSGGGTAVEIPSATVSAAGVMTAAQVSLLDSRAPTADPTFSGTVTAPHIHGNLAGAVYTHIRNGSGATLTKGTPVRVTGYHAGSDRPLVGPADAASDATMPCIGILDADVANNADGHAVVLGVIENLNTAGYAVNQQLYIASGGGLTGTAPAVRAQSAAIVERVNANTGAILVTASNVTGSLASQSAGAVAITGGSITGLSSLSAGTITASTSATVTANTASTSTTTGALVVTGGVGIGGAINTGADCVINGLRLGRGVGNATTNVAFGLNAGNSIQTGTPSSQEVAIGNVALATAHSGSGNCAVGSNAMQFLSGSSSASNTSIGTSSLFNIATSSNDNVAAGANAGRYAGTGTAGTNTLCSTSVFIGTASRPAASGQTNQVVIGGLNAIGDGSNTTVIGTASTTQSRIFGGNALTTGANGQSTQLGQSTTLITPLSGATQTAAALIPANSIVIGVTARVTTAITGATSFDIGDGTTANLFGDDVAVALGTTSQNTIAPTRYATATNVVLTANGGNFTAGAVRLTVHFLTLVAPTS